MAAGSAVVVLVIEDSAPMRKLICHAVQRMDGAIVVEAEDGVDALAKLEDIHPDVILTDLNMPGIDGFAFIAKLRQKPGYDRIPVVVLTTEVAEEDRLRAEALGVAAYITKPIRQQDVVRAVEAVLGPRAVSRAPTPPPIDLLSAPLRGAARPGDAGAFVILRLDYDSADDLVSDYDATLCRGEIVVGNHRALPTGTVVRLALSFPGLAEPVALDGEVRSSVDGHDPTLDVAIHDGPQRALLADLIGRIRAAKLR
jgi:two-component system chemotaxis response regulator CheY